MDVLNPVLIDDDLTAGAEVPEEIRVARAPQDLGAEPEPAQNEPPENPGERGGQEPPGAIGELPGDDPADGAEAAAENPGTLTALMGEDWIRVVSATARMAPRGRPYQCTCDIRAIPNTEGHTTRGMISAS